jgi:YaiO family outer membrane protein
MPRLVLLWAFLVLSAVPAAAQDDILVKAREAATSGRRQEALTMLEARLAAVPNDVDARLLYGLILSWDKRYDEARPVLRQVLAQTPDYTDARVALMNVEYWTGHSKDALALANEILAKNPGNTTARAVRERIEAASRPWWVKTEYTVDAFNDGRDAWQEAALWLTRRTPIGPIIVRGSHAERFGDTDDLIEAEFYPRIRPGTYAYIAVGGSPSAEFYPKVRAAFDFYQSIGHGFEISGGTRAMDFDTVTHIYLGTLSKYIGNWMLTAKVYHVPAEGDLDSTSFYGGFRRYYGSDGTSYVGLSYGHGLSKQEVYAVSDLVSLDANSIRGELDHLAGARVRISLSGATSRQERVNGSPLWQTTVTAGLAVQF